MKQPAIVKWELTTSELADLDRMGARIQRRRVELGHTIESLMLATGIDGETIRAMERGRAYVDESGITWRTLGALLFTLRVELRVWVRA